MQLTVTSFTGALALLAAAPLASAQETPRPEAEPALGKVGTRESAALPVWLDDFKVGALVRAFWGYADEDLGGGAINGFDFYDVDIWAELPMEGGYDFRASFDADTGTALLEDAYVHWVHDERFEVTAGSFKPHVLFTSAVDPELQMFNERSALGSFFDFWDIGVQASGRVVENLDYYASITNGSDGKNDDKLWVLRGEWDFQGQHLPLQEGQNGLNAEQDVQLGLVFFQDTGDQDTGLGLDVLARFERFTLQGEIMDLDDGLGGNVGLKSVPLALDGNSVPWAIAGSTMVSDTMQVAGRIQATDNDDSTRIVTFALDYFPTTGPVTLIAQIDRYDSDGNKDGFVLQLGASLGHTRQR